MHCHERLLVFILWHLSRSYKAVACLKHSSGLRWIKCYWKLPIPCIRQLEVRDLKVSVTR